jgi:hypothetical protein
MAFNSYSQARDLCPTPICVINTSSSFQSDREVDFHPLSPNSLCSTEAQSDCPLDRSDWCRWVGNPAERIPSDTHVPFSTVSQAPPSQKCQRAEWSIWLCVRYDIVMRLGWLIDGGFRIGWLDLLTPYSHSSGLQAIQRAIALLHTFLFTVAHALGFSVFTSRIPATDL